MPERINWTDCSLQFGLFLRITITDYWGRSYLLNKILGRLEKHAAKANLIYDLARYGKVNQISDQRPQKSPKSCSQRTENQKLGVPKNVKFPGVTSTLHWLIRSQIKFNLIAFFLTHLILPRYYLDLSKLKTKATSNV